MAASGRLESPQGINSLLFKAFFHVQKAQFMLMFAQNVSNFVRRRLRAELSKDSHLFLKKKFFVLIVFIFKSVFLGFSFDLKKTLFYFMYLFCSFHLCQSTVRWV